MNNCKPFRPFVTCVRPKDRPGVLICTPWNYSRNGFGPRDEGAPITIADVFDVDAADTSRVVWSNYEATVELVATKVAGFESGRGQMLTNMTTHSHGPEFSPTRWRLEFHGRADVRSSTT